MRNPAVIFFSVVFILCARAIEPEVPAGGERITVPESLNAYADPAHGKAARLDHNTWHIQVDRADEARPFGMEGES